MRSGDCGPRLKLVTDSQYERAKQQARERRTYAQERVAASALAHEQATEAAAVAEAQLRLRIEEVARTFVEDMLRLGAEAPAPVVVPTPQDRPAPRPHGNVRSWRHEGIKRRTFARYERWCRSGPRVTGWSISRGELSRRHMDSDVFSAYARWALLLSADGRWWKMAEMSYVTAGFSPDAVAVPCAIRIGGPTQPPTHPGEAGQTIPISFIATHSDAVQAASWGGCLEHACSGTGFRSFDDLVSALAAAALR